MFEETRWLDAHGHAELVRRREANPRELVESAIARIEEGSRQVASFFETYDVWVSATTPQEAPPLGWFDSDDPAETWRRVLEFARDVPLANMTGQPAMSVPLHWTPERGPVGVHVLGRFGDERTLFALAGELERAAPWAQHRPRVPATATT